MAAVMMPPTFSAELSGLPAPEFNPSDPPLKIARSDPGPQIFELASKLLTKYEGICKKLHVDFKLEDYFSEYDIHLHGSKFLRAVIDCIAAIMYRRRVCKFAYEWSVLNTREKVLEVIQLHPTPQQIFTKEDFEKHGELFLSHAIYSMRISLRGLCETQAAEREAQQPDPATSTDPIKDLRTGLIGIVGPVSDLQSAAHSDSGPTIKPQLPLPAKPAFPATGTHVSSHHQGHESAEPTQPPHKQPYVAAVAPVVTSVARRPQERAVSHRQPIVPQQEDRRVFSASNAPQAARPHPLTRFAAGQQQMMGQRSHPQSPHISSPLPFMQQQSIRQSPAQHPHSTHMNGPQQFIGQGTPTMFHPQMLSQVVPSPPVHTAAVQPQLIPQGMQFMPQGIMPPEATATVQLANMYGQHPIYQAIHQTNMAPHFAGQQAGAASQAQYYGYGALTDMSNLQVHNPYGHTHAHQQNPQQGAGGRTNERKNSFPHGGRGSFRARGGRRGNGSVGRRFSINSQNAGGGDTSFRAESYRGGHQSALHQRMPVSNENRVSHHHQHSSTATEPFPDFDGADMASLSFFHPARETGIVNRENTCSPNRVGDNVECVGHVWLHNIADAGASDVANFFRQNGLPVSDADVDVEHVDKNEQRFGFVRLNCRADIRKALQLSGLPFGPRRITVQVPAKLCGKDLSGLTEENIRQQSMKQHRDGTLRRGSQGYPSSSQDPGNVVWAGPDVAAAKGLVPRANTQQSYVRGSGSFSKQSGFYGRTSGVQPAPSSGKGNAQYSPQDVRSSDLLGTLVDQPVQQMVPCKSPSEPSPTESRRSSPTKAQKKNQKKAKCSAELGSTTPSNPDSEAGAGQVCSEVPCCVRYGTHKHLDLSSADEQQTTKPAPAVQRQHSGIEQTAAPVARPAPTEDLAAPLKSDLANIEEVVNSEKDDSSATLSAHPLEEVDQAVMQAEEFAPVPQSQILSSEAPAADGSAVEESQPQASQILTAVEPAVPSLASIEERQKESTITSPTSLHKRDVTPASLYVLAPEYQDQTTISNTEPVKDDVHKPVRSTAEESEPAGAVTDAAPTGSVPVYQNLFRNPAEASSESKVTNEQQSAAASEVKEKPPKPKHDSGSLHPFARVNQKKKPKEKSQKKTKVEKKKEQEEQSKDNDEASEIEITTKPVAETSKVECKQDAAPAEVVWWKTQPNDSVAMGANEELSAKSDSKFQASSSTGAVAASDVDPTAAVPNYAVVDPKEEDPVPIAPNQPEPEEDIENSAPDQALTEPQAELISSLDRTKVVSEPTVPTRSTQNNENTSSALQVPVFSNIVSAGQPEETSKVDPIANGQSAFALAVDPASAGEAKPKTKKKSKKKKKPAKPCDTTPAADLSQKTPSTESTPDPDPFAGQLQEIESLKQGESDSRLRSVYENDSITAQGLGVVLGPEQGGYIFRVATGREYKPDQDEPHAALRIRRAQRLYNSLLTTWAREFPEGMYPMERDRKCELIDQSLQRRTEGEEARLATWAAVRALQHIAYVREWGRPTEPPRHTLATLGFDIGGIATWPEEGAGRTVATSIVQDHVRQETSKFWLEDVGKFYLRKARYESMEAAEAVAEQVVEEELGLDIKRRSPTDPDTAWEAMLNRPVPTGYVNDPKHCLPENMLALQEFAVSKSDEKEETIDKIAKLQHMMNVLGKRNEEN